MNGFVFQAGFVPAIVAVHRLCPLDGAHRSYDAFVPALVHSAQAGGSDFISHGVNPFFL